MTVGGREERANAADALSAAAFSRVVHGSNPTGVALVAVGGYGRRELAPFSDLDLVLVHDDDVDVDQVANEIWYPLWDSGAAIDHSVRAVSEATSAATRDLRVALGLLDARHLAGDPSLTLRLRTALLAQWRRDARLRLPELRALVSTRGERQGELAHASVPDLKDSTGGLRDATALKALVASWLVDVPHTELERCRRNLLDVRDALHRISGRPTDRVVPEVWADLADVLAFEDAAAVQRHVRETGRRVTHLSRLTWRRVEGVLARPVTGAQRRGPDLERLAAGVAVTAGEVVLDRRAAPAHDGNLLLRAAAEAAERGLILAPATAARLVRERAKTPMVWDEEARNLLTRLLAAGPDLLPVWETLDETGGLQVILPEWERIRLLPHASIVHRFTVDRHVVESCIEASRLLRRVARTDVLLIATLLHDIGKGSNRDHSAAGEEIAAVVARRMGFGPDDAGLVARLVRQHLLLSEVATTRDLDDPGTIAHVAGRVQSTQALDLLAVLTEADARATSAMAWTPWRAGLVHDLTARTRTELTVSDSPRTDLRADGSQAQIQIPASVRENKGRVEVQVAKNEDVSRVTVVSGDRVGLLTSVAALFAVRRSVVRALRAWTQGDHAVSVWDVEDQDLEVASFRQHLQLALDSGEDPRPRARRSPERGLAPSVAVRPGASARATVLEVRAENWAGVLHCACSALASLDLSVRTAHVDTFGPQAVEVFYVQEVGAGALSDERAAAAARAVRRALAGTVTLDA